MKEVKSAPNAKRIWKIMLRGYHWELVKLKTPNSRLNDLTKLSLFIKVKFPKRLNKLKLYLSIINNLKIF